MELGVFVIDTQVVAAFFEQSVFAIIVDVLAMGGWLIFFAMLFFAGLTFWTDYRQGKFTADWKYRVLAIDIPQENVQTPLAVEQMFAHLAGALDVPGIKDTFWDGYKQRYFSFEIVSIEGYIQFVIWTEEAFVDLVEASMYAQYPEAEITEIEDYVGTIPESYPSESHEVWLGDFGLSDKFAFPIRSYRDFEHNISKDTVLKDPMGTFLESFSRIGPGEQMWFQILVQPTGNGWKEDVIKEIKKLIGEKVDGKKGLLEPLTNNALTKEFFKSLEEVNSQLTGALTGGESPSESKDDGEKNQLRYLTPGQNKILERMEEKITKLGFKTKMRAAYIARKEVFNPRRGVNALIGAINQYNIPSANSIVPTSTGASTNKKKLVKTNALLKAYKKRKLGTGGNPFIFNIEELATVWHFPMSHVQTPLVQKAASKTAAPPVGLPVESVIAHNVALNVSDDNTADGSEYTTDSGDVIQYNDEVDWQ